MSSFAVYLERVADGHSLTMEESAHAFQIIMNGGATPAQTAALLVALRMKGETAAEIAGAAQVMRKKAVRLEGHADAIDVCGTGGDGKGLLNISTATAFVVAGCGVRVAKHGNRGVSSKSGSADVLTALGVYTRMSPQRAAQALDQAGITFLLATVYHPAMRHVAPTRQELGLRTIFNSLGPLTNPAGVRRQLLGVYDRSLMPRMIEAARSLDMETLWVVHSEDGLDELSIAGVTYVTALSGGEVRSFEVTPETAGLERHSLDALKGGDAHENARHIRNLLRGEPSPFREMVLLNAAAALMVAGAAASLAEGAVTAAAAIDDGRARRALDALTDISNQDSRDD